LAAEVADPGSRQACVVGHWPVVEWPDVASVCTVSAAEGQVTAGRMFNGGRVLAWARNEQLE
jgi:hypothetical protein